MEYSIDMSGAWDYTIAWWISGLLSTLVLAAYFFLNRDFNFDNRVKEIVAKTCIPALFVINITGVVYIVFETQHSNFSYEQRLGTLPELEQHYNVNILSTESDFGVRMVKREVDFIDENGTLYEGLLLDTGNKYILYSTRNDTPLVEYSSGD